MPAASPRRVILTGAGGLIGSTITPLLPPTWDLLGTDLHPAPGIGRLDVTDLDACREVFAGADAVVHLAGNPDPNATWDNLHGPNVVGTYVVAQAAIDSRIRRLVLPSSQQAVSGYPVGQQVRSEDPPRPANLYGATKAWAESIGAWVAGTSPTSVVALRIGHFGVTIPTGEDATARNLAAWLSPADCAELVRAGVEGDVNGFTVINGISANRYRHARLGPAEQALGYQPTDDSWTVGP